MLLAITGLIWVRGAALPLPCCLWPDAISSGTRPAAPLLPFLLAKQGVRLAFGVCVRGRGTVMVSTMGPCAHATSAPGAGPLGRW